MHIAVDARNIKTADRNEKQYTLTLLQKLIEFQFQHQFIIITTQTGLLPALSNMKEYIIESKVETYLQLRRWHSKTLPGILKKAGADALLIINGTTVNAAMRQVVFMSSPEGVTKPFTKNIFYPFFKKSLNSLVAKADAIATISGLQQHVIAKQLLITTGKILPVGYTIPSVFNPINWQQKEAFLQEHTVGCEYFLYTGPFNPDTFLLVLKAFSLFKKRQLSNMQLMAAGQFIPDKLLAEKLATYKYRSDVKLYQNDGLQIMPTLYAAAYGLIYLDETALTAYPVATALQCEVPVIGFENCAAVKELAGATALYALATAESLAEQMKQLYKDENLRHQLIANVARQMPVIDGDRAVQKLWSCLQPDGA